MDRDPVEVVDNTANRYSPFPLNPEGRAELPYQRRIRDASREELEAAVLAMVDLLYHDGSGTEWERDTIENVAEVLIDAGFTPRRGES